MHAATHSVPTSFSFNASPTTAIYPLSLHDALPILPRRIARAYRRYRFGPGAYQVALAVEGGVPWTHEASRHAGTVHLGGSDRKSTRLNSSHVKISYAVFCLKKKTT